VSAQDDLTMGVWVTFQIRLSYRRGSGT